MFCGAGSFSHMDDVVDHPRPTPSTPTAKKKGSSKNPYSARGLDKFSAVLTELEARRQKILAQVGAQGVPVVLRFMYKSTQDWVPIVVKLPPPQLPEKHGPSSPPSNVSSPPRAVAAPGGAATAALTKSPAPSASTPSGDPGARTAQEKGGIVKKRPAFSWGAAVGRTRREMSGCIYWTMVLAVVLLCLAMSGKTFAICCTSVLLYVLPGTAKETTGRGGGVRRSMGGREYGRRPSDKRLVPAHAAT